MSESPVQKKEESEKKVDKTASEVKTCFVIMPISDSIGYDIGHFKRVYEFIIKPACKKAGFNPVRADDVKGTNMIVIDILRRIISAEIAICDLSSRNPNVLYELGIRQSFDLPVTLIKDELTERIFDIQGFRDVHYSSSLRIDEVNIAVENLAVSLKETYENKQSDINSIVDLLGISKATVKDPVQISPDTEVLLNAIKDINSRIYSYERANLSIQKPKNNLQYRVYLGTMNDGTKVYLHEKIMHKRHGEGTLVGADSTEKGDLLTIAFKDQVLNIPVLSESLFQDNELPF